MDELLKDFLTETSDQLEAIGAQLVRFERDPSDARILANIFRLVHAVKAACGFLDLRRLEKLALCAEMLIVHLRDGAAANADAVPLVLETIDRLEFILGALAEGRGEPQGDDDGLIAKIQGVVERGGLASRCGDFEGGFGAETTPPERRAESVRISLVALDNLATLTGELASVRNRLAAAASATRADRLQAPLRRLSEVAADLQSGLRSARTLPVEILFAGLPRLVRELTARRGQRVDLSLRGGEIEIERPLVEALREPLARLIRDAIDHGIESAEERRLRGKPEAGAIEVRALSEGGVLRIEVADDGRGLDFDAIRERAHGLGLGSREELAALSEADLWRFVPDSGAVALGGLAGRAAGLRGVRAKVEPIGGSASLENRAGGAAAVLRMRLATAAVPAFILGAGEERYALPRRLVEDVLELDPDADGVLIDVKGTLALVTVDGVFPAGELRMLMGSPARSFSPCPAPRVALKLRADSRSFALVVDALLEMPDISVRPLPHRLPDNPMVSGAAVLDDGSVVLVLDPAGLSSALDLAKPAAARIPRAPAIAARSSSTSFVVFRSEGPATRALPVSAVARILAIPPERRESAEGAGAFRIEDTPILLIGMDGDPVALNRASAPMALLLADGDDRLGLIVDEIVDIVEPDPDGDLAGRGAAKWRAERPEILDPAPLFARHRARVTTEVAAVLILEPAAFFREMIAAALTRHGYRALAVGDIGAASAAVESRNFAAVLLDVDMAVAHDGEIPRRLRDAVGGRPPAFIGLSSHGGPTMRARADRAGLASAVGKFDRGRLLGALRSALSPAELAA